MSQIEETTLILLSRLVATVNGLPARLLRTAPSIRFAETYNKARQMVIDQLPRRKSAYPPPITIADVPEGRVPQTTYLDARAYCGLLIGIVTRGHVP